MPGSRAQHSVSVLTGAAAIAVRAAGAFPGGLLLGLGSPRLLDFRCSRIVLLDIDCIVRLHYIEALETRLMVHPATQNHMCSSAPASGLAVKSLGLVGYGNKIGAR